MKIARALPLLSLFAGLSWHAQAQASLDSSGDSMLTGTYYFRQVFYFFDNNGDFTDAASLYGNITFSGSGTYTLSGSVCDAANGCTSSVTAVNTTGTYVIGANGFGYISNPYVAGDLVYGLVSKGIFIGSTTETAQIYNDLFVAAPVGSTQATNATLSGTYTIDYADPSVPENATFQMTADGQGNLGTINATGYIEGGFNSDGSVAFINQPQTLTGVHYAFSNGGASVFLGGNGQILLPTSFVLYISPDGNFIFGGAYNGFDFFVGVRSPSSAPNFQNLYYQAGVDGDYSEFDTYYGSFNVVPGGELNEHVRLDAFDDTFFDFYQFNADGSYDDPFLSQHFVFGLGGAIRIGVGEPFTSSGTPCSSPSSTCFSPLLGLNVAIQAPSFSNSGVYINPVGVVNAASSSPFTAFVSPGEYISIFGTNLANTGARGLNAPTLPLPTSQGLGGVQVMINGRPAALNFVSPNQINAVVPYFTESVAQIQVINNGQPSNIVTELVGLTSAGIFTDANGYAVAEHGNFSLITPSNPAQPGEEIFFYVNGLGSLSPAVNDGFPGTGTQLTTNIPMVDVDGTPVVNTPFSGLAPGFAGVYQVNVTIPTGLSAGDHFLDIGGPDSYNQGEALISIGSGSAVSAAEPTAQNAHAFIPGHRVKRPGRQRHLDANFGLRSRSGSSQ